MILGSLKQLKSLDSKDRSNRQIKNDFIREHFTLSIVKVSQIKRTMRKYNDDHPEGF